MYRVLTVAREFGSGGASIAKLAAERLGWKLLDNALVMQIAAAARVEPELARRFDEQVDGWLHRVSRLALWQGGFEGVAAPDAANVFDARTQASLAANLIREARRQGECVVVGRAGQCILQGEADAFHVFVYAPWRQKVARVRKRVGERVDPAELIRTTDRMRNEYVRLNYGCDWKDPHMYHLMVSSCIGEETAAAAILAAMRGFGR
ncbi:MAG: cytidylate kinase-like family protein [Bryobacterales bacterium]|nr:cytidylate kinase-like family protein [Bryobacterales bacterium]